MRARSRRPRSSFRLGRWLEGERQIPALGLAVLWVFGVVLAPIVHLSLHGLLAPHDHSPGGRSHLAHVIASEGAHCHDGQCHADHEDRDVAEASAQASSDDEAPADHGRGSLLHGDLAALFPSPPFLIPPFVAIGELALPALLDDAIDAPPAPYSVARGPPRSC